MYWTDAQRGVIESSALDGTGRAVLIDERRAASPSSNTSSVVRPHYYGIALDRRYIYYTDWSRGSVHAHSYCCHSIGTYDFPVVFRCNYLASFPKYCQFFSRI